MIEKAAQRIELRLPEWLVEGEPCGGILHGGRCKGAADDPTCFRAFDQAGRFEHGEMLHETWQRHAGRCRQFGHTAAASAELFEYAAARGVRKRREDQVEMGIGIVNHVVYYERDYSACQAAAATSQDNRDISSNAYF